MKHNSQPLSSTQLQIDMMQNTPDATGSVILGSICGLLPLALGFIGFVVMYYPAPGDYEGVNAAFSSILILLVALLIYSIEAIFMSACYESRSAKKRAFSRGLFLGLGLSYFIGLIFSFLGHTFSTSSSF